MVTSSENVDVPVTVKLSLIVVSDVECPMLIGTPDVAVPIVIPLDVLELSIFKVDVLSNEILEPSTTSAPFTSSVDPSKVRFDSPCMLVASVNVGMRLSAPVPLIEPISDVVIPAGIYISSFLVLCSRIQSR